MTEPCKFARAAKNGEFEYGHITIKNAGGKDEARTYVVKGTAPSMREALILNGMALEGQPNQGGGAYAFRDLTR